METLFYLLGLLNDFGLIVFAASGGILAAKLRMDIIGFMILGISTAIGGGTIRDLILDQPVFWVMDYNQLLISAISAIVAGLITRYFGQIIPQKTFEWMDALGLSAFTVTGYLIAQSAGANPVICVVSSVLTATAGGLIRDIIANETPFITSSNLYATASLLGGCSIYFLQPLLPMSSVIGTSFLFTLLLRSGAILWDWKPPFTYHPKEPHSS